MSNANKVRCTQGHFFDLEKFSCCPVCQSGVADNSGNQSSTRPATSIRPSRLGKTAILIEDPPAAPPAGKGKAGGIRWKLWPKVEKEPDLPKAEPVSVQPVEADPVPVQPVQVDPIPVEPAPPKPAEQPAAPPAGQQNQPGASSLTQAVAATGHGAFSPLPKTTSYYDLAAAEPPTGWLVCVKGAHQGQAFACKAGRNKIGRNPDCYINPINETSITREPQAVILYEPKKRVFYLESGTSDGLVYYNDEPLFGHEQLKAYDKIELGNALFVFMPLCGEQFNWSDYID